MAGFLFALIVVLAAGLGARDQVLVARLAPRPMVLVVAAACAVASGLAAGWLGISVAPMLKGPARTILVAMALALAALELLVISPGRRPLEPTRSLGALTIVLLAQQLTDAARLLIFAIAATSPLPAMAMAGGAIGGAVSVIVGWMGGEAFETLPLRLARRVLGLVMLALAAWLAYNR